MRRSQTSQWPSAPARSRRARPRARTASRSTTSFSASRSSSGRAPSTPAGTPSRARGQVSDTRRSQTPLRDGREGEEEPFQRSQGLARAAAQPDVAYDAAGVDDRREAARLVDG